MTYIFIFAIVIVTFILVRSLAFRNPDKKYSFINGYNFISASNRLMRDSVDIT